MTEEQWIVARQMFPGESLTWLQQAVDETKGTHTLEDILRSIARNEVQVWRGQRSVGISEFLNFPRKRVLNMFLAGGDLSELQDCLAGVEAFARGGGAQTLMFCGRLTPGARRRLSGWDRAFPDFEPDWICMTKGLT